MIKVQKHGVFLKPTKLAFETVSTFNPGVLQEGDNVHVIYRAQDEKFVSTLGYARLKGPLDLVERWDHPFAQPHNSYEKKGIEDPCLVRIGDTVYMTYVGHDGVDAVIALMAGPDILHLKRQGIISAQIPYKKVSKLFPYSKLKDDYYLFAAFYEKYNPKNILVWEKDGVLFPAKIRGRFAMLHRILPDIQLIRFEDFWQLKDKNYWFEHLMHIDKHIVMEGRFGWESRHIGGGAPPIKTPEGWLTIYHGVEEHQSGRIYHAGAALLDLKYPTKTIARLPEPLISPDQPYEREGHVNNVVFPTGVAVFKDKLFIYYGTSDTYSAVASVGVKKLLAELLRHRIKTNKSTSKR